MEEPQVCLSVFKANAFCQLADSCQRYGDVHVMDGRCTVNKPLASSRVICPYSADDKITSMDTG